MNPKGIRLRERLITDITLVRLFASVDSDMHGQVLLHVELLWTNVTSMRLFAGVRPLMNFEIFGCVKLSTAVGALERSFACMNCHHMNFQIPLESESVSTNFAKMRSLISMHHFVQLEC